MLERLKNIFRKRSELPNNLHQKPLSPKLPVKIAEALKLIRLDEENAWRIDLLTKKLRQDPSNQEVSLKWFRTMGDNSRSFKQTISERVELICDFEVPPHLRTRLDQPLKINTMPYSYREENYGTQIFNIEGEGELPKYIFNQNNIPDWKN